MGFPGDINLDPGHIIGTVAGDIAAAIATGGASLAEAEAGALLGYFAATGSTKPTDWMANMSDELRQVLDDLGISGYGVPLAFFADALHGNVSAQDLWEALSQDVAAIEKNQDKLAAYENANYTNAWNLATDEAHALASLRVPANGMVPPTPTRAAGPTVFMGMSLGGYNGAKVLSDGLVGVRDIRDAADDLFAHGWYAEGNQARDAWLTGLVDTPGGALFASSVAIASGNRVRMAKLAEALDQASISPDVINMWHEKVWDTAGPPSITLGPLAEGLRQHASPAPPPAPVFTLGGSGPWLSPLPQPKAPPVITLGGSGPWLAPVPAPATPTSKASEWATGIGALGLVAGAVTAAVGLPFVGTAVAATALVGAFVAYKASGLPLK